MLVGTLLALLAAALVLSLVELGGDPQPVAKAPANAATADPVRRARRRRRDARADRRAGADRRPERDAEPA